jgi:hypothetical protein
MYAYVLKIICEHIGKRIPSNVVCVYDHNYSSLLVASGSPIPLPNPYDFPLIGFLSLSDIPKEIKRIDNPLTTAKPPLRQRLMRSQSDQGAIAEDMAEYREVLSKALKKGVSIVSFRH